TRVSRSGTPAKRRASARLSGSVPVRYTVSAAPSRTSRINTPCRLANENGSGLASGSAMESTSGAVFSSVSFSSSRNNSVWLAIPRLPGFVRYFRQLFLDHFVGVGDEGFLSMVLFDRRQHRTFRPRHQRDIPATAVPAL